MVKEARAAIKTWTPEEAEEYGGLPGPVVRTHGNEINQPQPTQAIVSLNMKVMSYFSRYNTPILFCSIHV